jgi:hypothetical protein
MKLLKKEEKLIKQAIINARNIQDFIWGDDFILKSPFDPIKWGIVFQKRVDKINEININNKNSKVELRKRLLQQAALSILALKIIDSDIEQTKNEK